MMTFEECSNYISNIHKFQDTHSNEDTLKLLNRVYKDQSPRIIHVAGTNGKGSTCAYISSILQEAGYRVGLFTSPHLVTMQERIVVNGSMISKDDFVDSFYSVRRAIEEEGLDYQPSFFKYIFLLAMDYFSHKSLDYIVLETGLGGRLDATNCIPKKDLCVITKIGLDHTEILGDTVEKIAFEKAGIIKEGVTTVFWDSSESVSRVIKNVCIEKKCTYYSLSLDNISVNSINKDGIDFSIDCDYYRYDRLFVSSQASYQSLNAALAVLGIRSLKDAAITDENIISGLEKAKWEGRMEEYSSGVYLDGAHNPDGIQAFISSVKNMPCEAKRYLLFSVVSDKQYCEMIKLIAESKLFKKVMVAPLDYSARALDINSLKKTFELFPDLDADFYESVDEAYEAGMNSKGSQDLLFIAGSLYLVGAIKEKAI